MLVDLVRRNALLTQVALHLLVVLRLVLLHHWSGDSVSTFLTNRQVFLTMQLMDLQIRYRDISLTVNKHDNREPIYQATPSLYPKHHRLILYIIWSPYQWAHCLVSTSSAPSSIAAVRCGGYNGILRWDEDTNRKTCLKWSPLNTSAE